MLIMCICLNCKYLIYCNVYYLVEAKHLNNLFKKDQLQAYELVNFYAYSPILYINSFLINTEHKLEWDVVNCLSYNEVPGNWIYRSPNDFCFSKHNYL